MQELKVGIIGLDTSHSIEFTRILQGSKDKKIEGMKIINCMRFSSPFQSEIEQDKRQKQLEEWGVKVTKNFEEAVNDVDVIMLEINNPALHLEYFKKATSLGKPVFLDKPPADNFKNAKEIFDIAAAKKIKIFSASSLRFTSQVAQLSREIPNPQIGMAVGPLGKASVGSSIIWYGVHTVEMLQEIMGTGAKKLIAYKDALGITSILEYSDGRRGIVQLNDNRFMYSIFAQNDKEVNFLKVDASNLYIDLLKKIKEFFEGKDFPVSWEESLEVQKILDAIEKSVSTGKEQIL